MGISYSSLYINRPGYLVYHRQPFQEDTNWICTTSRKILLCQAALNIRLMLIQMMDRLFSEYLFCCDVPCFVPFKLQMNALFEHVLELTSNDTLQRLTFCLLIWFIAGAEINSERTNYLM